MIGLSTKKANHSHIGVRLSICIKCVSSSIRSLLFTWNLESVAHYRHRDCRYRSWLSYLEKSSKVVRRIWIL